MAFAVPARPRISLEHANVAPQQRAALAAGTIIKLSAATRRGSSLPLQQRWRSP